jgi:ketosteroid isomerase-like protein
VSARDLAVCLAESFGDADAIVSLLAEDAEWWITPTVGVMASPTVGRDAIGRALRVIFEDLYADTRIQLHAVISEGDETAVRFTMRALAIFAGNRRYENEYVLWIQCVGDEVSRVWEYLDVAHVTAQFDLR